MRRIVASASKRLTLKPGTKWPLKLKLNRTGRALLRTHRSLTITVRVTTTRRGQPQQVQSATIQMTIKHRKP